MNFLFEGKKFPSRGIYIFVFLINPHCKSYDIITDITWH